MGKKIMLFIVLALFGLNNLNAQCFFKTYSTELLNEYHEGFYVTPKGKIVCRFFDGFSFFDGSTWKNLQTTAIPHGNSLAMEENGTVWLGSFYAGLTKFVDTNNITNYDTSDGLASMEIQVIKIAPDGKIWIGHYGGGVSVWNGTSFTVYDTTNGLSDMFIRQIAFDKNGKVYIGSMNGTVDVFDGIKFTKMNLPANGEINDIAIADNGDIYILTYNMTSYMDVVYRFDGNKWYQLNFTKLGAEPSINKILTDQANHLYLASYNGLLKFDGKNESLYTQNSGLFADNVSNMGITEDGTIYLTSNTGITEFKQATTFVIDIKQPNGSTYDGKIVVFKKMKGVKAFTQIASQSYTASPAVITVNTTGDFIILVEPNASVNPDLVGTYFGDVDIWDKATVVQNHFCESKIDTYAVKVIQIPPMPKGKGYISGTVKSTDGTRGVAEPIKDVDVTLKKVPGGVIVKKTKTNDNGVYEFTELDTATYAIFVDIPGLPQDTPRIVKITETDTSFKNQDYKVDSTGIKAGDFSGIKEKRNDFKASVYPNPFSDKLFVRFFNNGITSVEIVNISGEVVRSFKETGYGEKIMTINFSDLPHGLYVLKINNGEKLSVFTVSSY